MIGRKFQLSIAAALAVGTLAAASIDVAAYVWPAYQPDPRWSELGIFKAGKGEWQNVWEAVPKWDGHRQPLVPLWGYEDESDPKVVEKKIDAAVSHGVNVFIYDWYWYGGRPFLEEGVNRGFLGAKNNEKMKFFLMWANHHVNWLWDNTVEDKRWESPRKDWLGFVTDEEFRTKLVPRWIENYFSKPNYYRIDNKPVLMIYEVGTFIEGVGGIEKAAAAIAYLRERAVAAGFEGVHLMACDYDLNAGQVKTLGIDSASIYNFVHWSNPYGNPDYDDWAKRGAERFDTAKDLGLKRYFAHASVGWDTNPRYPAGSVQASAVDSTPEKFEASLRRAKDWTLANLKPGERGLITVNSWNEWTEGSYLEPDTVFGYGYLEAIRRVFPETYLRDKWRRHSADPSTGTLSDDFLSPPACARPQTWYHMMNGNVTKAGITKDFEALAEQGVGGVHMLDAGLDMPSGPVAFASDEWFDMMRHAAKEAKRLGLEIVVPPCSGWSSAGGPWITPDKAMKKLVFSESRVKGGGVRKFTLPANDLGNGFYEDIAIVAFPTPKRELVDKVVAPTVGKVHTFEFAEPTAVNGIEFRFSFTWGWFIYGSYTVEASDDGNDWRQVGGRKLVLSYGGSHDLSLRYHSLDSTVAAKYIRITLDIPAWGDESFRIEELRPVPRLGVSEVGFKSLAMRVDAEYPDVNSDPDGVVDPQTIRRLEIRPGSDGVCEWEAPEGNWTVLRLGYACNGKKNHPATPTGEGLEVDKLDGEAVEFQFEQYVGRLCRTLGPEYCGRTNGVALTGVLIDSYEVGAQNWTKRMPEEFAAIAGYDLSPYLPALAGHVVGSAAKTERFLGDFRRVIGELFATRYAGTMRRKADEYDLDFWLEPYGNLPGDGLAYGEYASIPMGEFWSHGQRQCDEFGSVRYAGYLAHVHGLKFVAAESFTGRPIEAGRWQTTPYSIKRQCDTVFAEGLNKVVFHRFTHQPWTRDDCLPGMTMGMWGMHFDRTQTWWPLVGEFLRYQSRCQAMLQRGVWVADVLFFAGEKCPNNGGYNPDDGTGEPFSLAPGWKFDVCNSKTLAGLKARDGKTYAADDHATEYSVVVLPKEGVESPELLSAVKRLEDEGVTIVRDGKVVTALREHMIARDADIAFKGARFAHRRDGGDDWYFVAVPNDAATTIEASFRVRDRRRPELWDAETGERYVPRSWRRDAGRVYVDLPMRPNGSMFVVFPEKPTTGVGTATGEECAYAAVRNGAAGKQVKLEKIVFPGVGEIKPTGFVDWTTLENFDMRHFSGTAEYTLGIPFAGELDLGDVKHFAEVFVNGECKARMWRPPFRCRVPAGEVVVKVTNLWPNRLIGDDYLEPNCVWEDWQVKEIPDWVKNGQPSPSPRKTFTTRRHWTKNDPLLPSGILGPVMVRDVK